MKKTELKLPDHVHAHGCPADPTRIEAFDVVRPEGQVAPGVYVVTRCIDCGGEIATRREATDAA